MKIIDFFKRRKKIKLRSDFVEDTIIESVDHPLLRKSKEEYRFPDLYKPPKVVFKIKRSRKKKEE